MDRIDQRTSEALAHTQPFSGTVRVGAELASVRSGIRTWLARSLSNDLMDEVLLASGEALANALEHGQPPVAITLEWVEGRTLRLRIRDSGKWHVHADASTRGRGIPIMTTLMDSLTVETTDGTAIELTRRFPS